MRQDTLREWAKEQRDRAAEREKAKREVTSLTQKRARVHAAHLTGNEVWDEYLRQVTELQEADRTQLDELAKEIESSQYLAAEDCARKRHEIAVLRARVDAREQCLGIPKAVLAARTSA